MIALITGAELAFWVCAPIMVLAALGMVTLRKPVYSALCLALVMVCLAVQYAALDAPFLFVAQIIVYTGAILMLFLFVLMLVGVDSKDSLVETIKGQRWLALIAALGFAMLLVFSVGNAIVSQPVGLEKANAEGNVPAIAKLLFTDYVFAFEATAALLITAAVAAMVLAHGERFKPKKGQREFAQARIRAYAEDGVHPGTRPNPGVFANHNSIATPALLPDGSVAEASVSQTLRQRGVVLEGDLAAGTRAAHAQITAAEAEAEGEAE